jgi:hypothetical protein
MRGLLLLVLFLGMTNAYPAFSQTGKASDTKPISAAQLQKTSVRHVESKKYLIGSLDVHSTNVGLNFSGHDIESIAGAIKKAPALQAKSEFESSDQYVQRRATFPRSPILPGISSGDYLAFVVNDGLTAHGGFMDGATLSYDADSATLQVGLYGAKQIFYKDSIGSSPRSPIPLELDILTVRDVITSRGRYIASNAFGVKKEVTRTDSEQYGIAVEQGSWPFSSEPSRILPKFSAVLPMSAADAQKIKPHLKLVAVCHLAEPYIYETVSAHEPTIDSPSETSVGLHFLQVTVEQVWVLNGATGEVIQKFSESPRSLP